MKKSLKHATFIWILFVFSSLVIGQDKNVTGEIIHQPLTELTKEKGLSQHVKDSEIPQLNFSAPNVEALLKEDEKRDKNGYFYRFGEGKDVNITLENSGVWEVKENGDRVWRLKIHQPGALAQTFIFSKFYLYGNTTIDVYDRQGRKVHRTYTKDDVLESGEQNLALCEGDIALLELIEPAGTKASELEMNMLMYIYRSYGGLGYTEKVYGDPYGNSSDGCQVNVNCSEGDQWQDEKRGVARIVAISGYSYGLCTGSLINNTAQDCKPYFLTAMHCIVGASNFNNWRFYFNFEAPACGTPSNNQVEKNQYITGAVKLAGSEDVNGNNITKSDFALLRLNESNETNTITKLKSFNAYWNGWDANNTAAPSGVSIHHPSGDIKKISTFTQPLTSANYSGSTPNTHWRVYWSETANGHGVTEGGSSGSPIFTYNNGNSRIVGKLSGGTSYCAQTNGYDLYGKLSYSWTSAGTTNAMRLKPWLDPGNTGAMVLDGSSDPCNGGGGNPDPDPDPDPDPGTGACTPTISQCDEYIANVTLSTINNSSNCDLYTDYSNISTTLTPGNTYQVGVVPGVVGYGSGAYYPGDVIGVWVDWNGNGTFGDANETIVTHALTQSSPATHNLHVPAAIAPGTYVMRVRINYDASHSGNISPCDDSQYGEVEDYRIVIAGDSNPNPDPNSYDLEVLLNNPASTSLQAPTASQQVSFTLRNNGPSKVPAGSTLWFGFLHVNNATQQENLYSINTNTLNNVDGVVLNTDFMPGQSISSANLGTVISNASISTSTYGNGDIVALWCLGVGEDPNSVIPTDPNDADNDNNLDYFIIDLENGSSSGIEELSMDAIQLYPNPTTGKVLIDLNSTFKNVEVVIYDITGKSVAKVNEVGAKSIVLDLSNLASGVYQVAVRTEKGIVMKKVVRE